MTINTIICFVLTLATLSSLYKLIMIKSLRKGFLEQDVLKSFLEFGITVADFRPFKVMKFLHLGKIVDSKFYYKFIRKIYSVQVFLCVLCFITLFVLNCFDSFWFLRMEI